MYLDGLRETENGRRESDQRPKQQNDSPPKEKGLYMDQALAKIKSGSFSYLLTLISGLTLLAAAVEMYGILYVFPVSQCDLHLSASEKGMLGGAVPLGVICSAHLWGCLADTKGRRAVILPTLFLAFFSSLCGSFVQNIYIFALFRFLNGFFVSGSSATIFAYLGEFYSNAKRARAIMGSAAIFSTSCVLIPMIAWGVINQEWQFHVPITDVTYKPWRFFFVVCSLPELIVTIILLFLPERPKFVLGQGNKEEAYQILYKICVNKLELETLEQGIVVEAIFSIGQIIIALIINRVGKFPIIFDIFSVCGIGGIVCMITDIPIVQVYAYTTLLSCGLASNVVNSVAVELFPTSLRAMAMCISLLFGRIGGIVGANVTALLLQSHCETVFYLSSSSLLVVAVAFFIPNIHKKSDVTQNDPRLSIISFRRTAN